MHRVLLVAALCLLPITAAAQTPPPAAAGVAPGSTLPDAPGKELVMRICSKCHAPDIVSQQDLDADGWKDLVNTMANNGANGTDDEFNQIIAYLTKAFPAK